LASYNQALELFRAVQDRLGEANTLKAIGALKLAEGQLEEALKLLDQTLQLYQTIGDRVGQANTYWTLGLFLAQREHFKEAEPLLAQAVELGNQFASGHPVTLHMESVLNQVRSQLENAA
ncbi:MAG: tetratricopeptide repeat protein, partial [Anaerolineae bacterium]|nr:tetratricopeptide repeat protein [Anaerolineae bacterium]